MGKYDLSVNDEYGAKSSLVWDVLLHPDWNFNEERFDADISIAVLTDAIEFSRQIQPVCLPRPSYEEVQGKGIVVGWGKSEYSGSRPGAHDTTPNKIIIPAVNGTHCYTTFYVLGSISSNRAFCGGYKDQGKAPCMGDSGGGFYFRDPSLSWDIRGIVSASVIDEEHGCDINKFTIYTNVARFTDWIADVVESTTTVIWQYVDFSCERNE